MMIVSSSLNEIHYIRTYGVHLRDDLSGKVTDLETLHTVGMSIATGYTLQSRPQPRVLEKGGLHRRCSV